MSTSQPVPPNPAPSPLSRRSDLPVPTLVLAAVLIAAIGFGAGFLAGHIGGGGDGHRRFQRGFAGAPGRAAIGGVPRFGTFPGEGAGSGTTAPGATPFGDVVAGTVTKVQGSSLILRTFRGQTVTVHTSSSTIVRLAGGATVADLKPGSVIFVTGTPGSDGTVSASRVLGGFVQPSTGSTTP